MPKFEYLSKMLKLEYPVVGLSPMDGVTDAPFCIITKKYGNPDIIFTEFTHVMGLCYGGENVLRDFYFEEMERPIVAQIYGAEPEYFYHAAKIVCQMGFDGVDINMGCPAKNVQSSGAGAALIRTPELAREIIFAVKRGVEDWVKDGKITGMKPKAEAKLREMMEKKKQEIRDLILDKGKITSPFIKMGQAELSLGQQNILSQMEDRRDVALQRSYIPVSVKTRIGYDSIVTDSWIENICGTKPDWISVHGRTLKQMYGGEANWDEIKKAVEIAVKYNIPAFANGDVKVKEDIQRILDHTGAFGVLIGRASEGNPFIFSDKFEVESDKNDSLTTSILQLTTIMLEHAELFSRIKTEERAFVQMRKHFGWYCQTISLKIQENTTRPDNNQSTTLDRGDSKIELELKKLKEMKIKLMRASTFEEVKGAVEEFLSSFG